MAKTTQEEIFSRNLCKIMEERKISQTKLANDCHFIRQSVSAWMCGKAVPRMDKIQILADYFHIRKSQLIEQWDNDIHTQILEKIRKLNDYGLTSLDNYLDFLLLNEGNVL